MLVAQVLEEGEEPILLQKLLVFLMELALDLAFEVFEALLLTFVGLCLALNCGLD